LPHFGVLRKKKKRKKSFDGDGDALLATLKFSRRKRRKTQGSNHLLFVTDGRKGKVGGGGGAGKGEKNWSPNMGSSQNDPNNLIHQLVHW